MTEDNGGIRSMHRHKQEQERGSRHVLIIGMFFLLYVFFLSTYIFIYRLYKYFYVSMTSDRSPPLPMVMMTTTTTLHIANGMEGWDNNDKGNENKRPKRCCGHLLGHLYVFFLMVCFFTNDFLFDENGYPPPPLLGLFFLFQ